MRIRSLVWAVFITLAFLWLTSRANWDIRRAAAPFLRAGAHWSEPARVQGAGLTVDEQNNIDIYKFARLATVYITVISSISP
jgi:hypothetical protein